jgi:hypothetical protein
MAVPSWLADTFAAMMLVVAGYCASRLVISRRWRRRAELDGDGVHVVMGVAMAGMLQPRLSPLPVPVWVAVFGVTTAWFGCQALRAYRGRAIGAWRCPHPVPHLVESGAMLYMLLAGPTAISASHAGGMDGIGVSSASAARFPALALALALFMIGYVVWTADRIPLVTAASEAIPAAVTAGGGTRTPAARAATMAATSTQPSADVAAAPQGSFLAPRCAACCRIAMGVTMGYTLIVML